MWAKTVLFLEEGNSLQALVEVRLWGDNLVVAGWSMLGVETWGDQLGRCDGVGVGEEGGTM